MSLTRLLVDLDKRRHDLPSGREHAAWSARRGYALWAVDVKEKDMTGLKKYVSARDP